VSEKCPDDAGVFVRHCNTRLCRPQLSLLLCNPLTAPIFLLRRPEYDRSRTVHEQRPQITIASLSDARKPLFFSAGVLARNEPEPGCELTPIVKSIAVRDRGNHCGGSYRPDSLYLRDPLTQRVLLEGLVDFGFHRQNTLIERLQLFIQSAEQAFRKVTQPLFFFIQELRNCPSDLNQMLR
jgi:hypothetical protein